MANGLLVTPGVGATIATIDTGGAGHAQIFKLSIDDGSATLIPATVANGLLVDVSRVVGDVSIKDGGNVISVDDAGSSLSVDDNAGSLTVDAPVATPVAVRLSNGSTFISALPVTDNGGLLSVDDGGGSLTVDGTIAATQSGTWNIATLTTITNDVPIKDGGNVISVDDAGGSLTIDGTITANQGAAAALSAAWPAKISDGTDFVGITSVSSDRALKVDMIKSVGPTTQADKSAFTEGSGQVLPVAAVFNDSIGGAPAEDQAAALRITARRGLHVNIRKDDGTELGVSAAPFRTDPTGTTTQPVLDSNSAAALTALQLIDDGIGTDASAKGTKGMMAMGEDGTNAQFLAVNSSGHLKIEDGGNIITIDGTIIANQGTANATPWNANIKQVGGNAVVTAASGIAKVGLTDEAGANYSETNALPVRTTSLEKTPVSKVATFTASQTDQAVWTPAGGKKFIVTLIQISATAAGVLRIFDNTNSAANTISLYTLVAGDQIVIPFFGGRPSSSADNVLRYTTGATVAGDFTVTGYESD